MRTGNIMWLPGLHGRGVAGGIWVQAPTPVMTFPITFLLPAASSALSRSVSCCYFHPAGDTQTSGSIGTTRKAFENTGCILKCVSVWCVCALLLGGGGYRSVCVYLFRNKLSRCLFTTCLALSFHQLLEMALNSHGYFRLTPCAMECLPGQIPFSLSLSAYLDPAHFLRADSSLSWFPCQFHSGDAHSHLLRVSPFLSWGREGRRTSPGEGPLCVRPRFRVFPYVVLPRHWGPHHYFKDEVSERTWPSSVQVVKCRLGSHLASSFSLFHPLCWVFQSGPCLTSKISFVLE